MFDVRRFRNDLVALWSGALLALIAVVGPPAGALSMPSGRQLPERLLDDPTRSDADRRRDPGSRPLEVYAWLGIEPGSTVVELFPFGGYNTHLLSRWLGPRGRVLATRTEFFGDQLAERIERAGLDNVVIVDRVADLEPESVDLVLSVRNLHDYYVFLKDVTPQEEYAGLLRALVPGGIFGVVDVRHPGEGADPDTHRISQRFVIEEVTRAGFELVDSSEMLANPDDDFGDSRFGERWDADRMLLAFRKPAR